VLQQEVAVAQVGLAVHVLHGPFFCCLHHRASCGTSSRWLWHR
jgi:hypothetical protein